MNLLIIGSGNIQSKYNSASYLLDNKILIDIPNGTCKNLSNMGINYTSIDNLLLTHFHGDHYFDIPFFLLGKYADKFNVLNIYCGNKGKNKIKALVKLAFPNTLKKIYSNVSIIFNYNNHFNIDDYDVEKILVDHGSLKPAYGYILKKDNIKIGFTGDTCLCHQVEYMTEKCDYLVCDCALITGNNKHMGIDNIKYLAEKYINCIFITSHMDDKTRLTLEEEPIKNIIVGEDGKTLNIKTTN